MRRGDWSPRRTGRRCSCGPICYRPVATWPSTTGVCSVAPVCGCWWGVYDFTSGQRQPATDAAGAPLPENAWVLDVDDCDGE